uniref:Uncharacterized protein n=1 Tax=Romanomermis culicivorax TaxID=13658 RepID=A0A915JW83_ROMCU
MRGLCTTWRDKHHITKENFKSNYRWREMRGKWGWPVLRSKSSLAGRGMSGFSRIMETVCGWPGAWSESMVTTFSAARDASVIIKGPIKLG